MFPFIKYYFLRWELVYKKGYQSFEPVSSTVTTKVKGFGFLKKATSTVDSLRVIDLNNKEDVPVFRIFDTADYVIPPSEYNSFFVLTNFVQTDQSPGTCKEVNLILIP